jgi:formylglycine-generating enzyme required for sulfatase activity/tRNA A-37 threonylcarbamoyl transferase component Bud32
MSLHEFSIGVTMTTLDGRYEISRELSSGGFGLTYLAKDLRRPGKPHCVVKQLRPQREFTQDDWQMARRLFEKEAETLEQLGRHDQIPLLLAHLEEKGKFYIVQDFIAGRTLRDELQAVKRLPEKDVVTLLRQGLTVLSYVHQQGVIHRDIKPANLIRRQDGVLCLIDFGIVKEFSAQQLGATAAQPQTRLVSTTVSIGTPGYTPLEQSRGKPLPASDVYALGMVAIEALTGKFPLDLDTDPATGEVIWQPGVKVSDPLADVLTQMVRHHYSRRYPTASEALKALENLEQASSASLLSVFTFETVQVNKRGKITTRRPGKADYFRESLGKGVTVDMVEIPAGQFVMGSSRSETDRSGNEGPQRTVTVPRFFMGRFQVTQAQYEAVMGENPSRFEGANRPVETVSWNDAVAFCDKLSQMTGRTYRLPSEAEWEYACRAGTRMPFHFGPTITTDLANYNGNYNYGAGPEGSYREGTTDVGSFPPNAFGLHDMHGNVWEWCQDVWHDSYEGASTNASAWIEGGKQERRVRRGGSWCNYPRFCRSACRFNIDPGYRHYFIGFRVICEAPGLP